MLTVTEVARDRLASKLARRRAADDVAMRFTRREGGWRLRLGRARPADTVIIHEGKTVLLLDKVVSQAMTNMTLDAQSTEAGPRLTLH